MDLTGFELADVPLALAERHGAVAVGTSIELVLASGDAHHVERGRAVVAAGGFEIVRWDVAPDRIEITATAQRALPDHVGADMRLLCCGLNPSLHAADAGVGYVTGSNRFWRAMALAGLSTGDRDPFHLLRHDRIGMTDLVKRAPSTSSRPPADSTPARASVSSWTTSARRLIPTRADLRRTRRGIGHRGCDTGRHGSPHEDHRHHRSRV